MAATGFDREIEQWRRTADEVLALARHAEPVDGDAAGDAVDFESDEDLAESDEADEIVERLITDTEAVLVRLASAMEGDVEAHAQATALLVADLVTAHALLAADEPAMDGGDPTFEDQVAELAGFVADPVFRAPGGDAAADAVVPDNVAAEFEEIENAAGKETFELVKNAAVQYSATALDAGLKALLAGEAAAKFEEVRRSLRKIRDALQRAATKIVAWITKRLAELLPEPVSEKLEAAFDTIKDKLEAGASGLIGSGLGIVLGRTGAEARWTEAIDHGKDINGPLAKVGEATAGHLERIEWVTKGREAIDKFGAKVVIGFVSKVPALQVAYFCAVAAVFAFLGWQLWDGIGDIGRLAPA